MKRAMGLARLCLALALCAAPSLTGCAAERGGRGAPVEPLEYGEIAARYNARAELLGHIWARAVVTARWRDADDRARWEQGEGHLQVIQPDKFALSAGKLGEVYVWMGSNDERYWLFDREGGRRMYIGRHRYADRERLAQMGFAASPLELLTMLGITPLPEPGAPGPTPTAGAARDGRIIIDRREADRTWRYTLDPATLHPLRIELFTGGPDPVLAATLERYEPVDLRGYGGIRPQMASRVEVRHVPTDASLTVSIGDMSDRDIRPAVFDPEALLEPLGVREAVDMDAPPPAPDEEE